MYIILFLWKKWRTTTKKNIIPLARCERMQYIYIVVGWWETAAAGRGKERDIQTREAQWPTYLFSYQSARVWCVYIYIIYIIYYCIVCKHTRSIPKLIIPTFTSTKRRRRPRRRRIMALDTTLYISFAIYNEVMFSFVRIKRKKTFWHPEVRRGQPSNFE